MRPRIQKRPALVATTLLGILTLSLCVIHAGQKAAAVGQNELPPRLYLPLVSRAPSCPKASGNNYAAGLAYQYDQDNPVRLAWNHADKNLALRGYTPNADGNLQRQLVNYGSDDPNQPPQFATLFRPARVPALTDFYRVADWLWAPSPDPGWRGSPISQPKVTALGLEVNLGETIYVPTSGYNIGGGMEVLILYAGENSVTLRYTREDSSGSAGYTIFIDDICTDPNLLALYQQHDDPSGPRYKYVGPRYSYKLPNLPAGHPLGTVVEGQIVVAISDTGAFQDPRSCNEWWQIRPAYSASCPNAQ